jgi:hypothetical protein
MSTILLEISKKKIENCIVLIELKHIILGTKLCSYISVKLLTH